MLSAVSPGVPGVDEVWICPGWWSDAILSLEDARLQDLTPLGIVEQLRRSGGSQG